MNESYWQKTSQHPCFKQLNKDIKTDILIIGGGLSGISCAYQLKETGKQITIVEKNLLGSHTSGHTTAKITLLQGLIYQKLVKHYNIETAYLYYQSQKEAIKGIKDLIEKEKIYCIYICYMDTCISGISHSGRPREGGNLFTVLWGVLERAKNIFFNRLYSIKNMSFTVLRTQKKTSHLLTRYFFDA